MLTKFKETADFIKQFCSETPQYGIILGTGLGSLVDEIEVEHSLNYSDIPNFPVSTVEGHSGTLVIGKLGGKLVVAMKGRFHYYEGYGMDQVTFPVRVMKLLGIEKLIVSNACGGVNDNFEIGDIMLIEDHINFFPEHPLRGKNIAELGPRFVDMSEPYNLKMIAKAEQIAAENNIAVQKGVYLALQGPTFETPAEYVMVRNVGADAVGMSTVPEVIVAKHMGMTCFGVSVITDLGVPGKIVEASHEEVQEVANKTTPKVVFLVKELVRQYQD